MAALRFAAIDVGSYEIEMAIYDISEKKGIRKIDHIRKVLSLGRETYRSGKLSTDTIEELCSILSGFKEKMREYDVNDYRAYATSALREAENREMILDRIHTRTGVEVQILSNSEQRLLFYKALAADESGRFEELIQEGTAIVDVGFGSLQLSLYDHGVLVTTQNVRLGALRVREMLSDAEGDIRSVNRMIEELVDNDISTFQNMFLGDINVKNIIGVGNNILYLVKKEIEPQMTDDMVSAVSFKRFYQDMMNRSPLALSQALDIPRDYATLMFPGTMVYKRVLDITEADAIWAPPICLCDGAAAEYARKNRYIKLKHDFDNDIIQNAYVISRRYNENQDHAKLLDSIVTGLFDVMKKHHGMGKREALLLRIAAILHDCGKYVSLAGAADCSYNILLTTEMLGLSHREREIVANVVRFNTTEIRRGNRIGNSNSSLTEEDYKLIVKLTAFLRVANAMDRSHRQKFKVVSYKIKEKELVITADTTIDISLEKGLFAQKADFFEEIFGIRPVLRKKGVN